MPKTQAHFTDKATAERARAALVATGVAASRIHIWNNIAGGAPFAANRDDATEGINPPKGTRQYNIAQKLRKQ